MDGKYQIKRILPEALSASGALKLVWRVFLEFEAPEYSTEGVQEFRRFIEVGAMRSMMKAHGLMLWGCFDGQQIAGVIAGRPPCHISLLFVDKPHHRKGIARALYAAMLEYYRGNTDVREATVNSSPYACEAYQRLGFVPMDTEQVANGLRFTPMKHAFGVE